MDSKKIAKEGSLKKSPMLVRVLSTLPYHICSLHIITTIIKHPSFGLLFSLFKLPFPLPFSFAAPSSFYGRGRIMTLEEKKVVLSFAAGKISGV
jgi:hypothetical protein